MGTSKGVIAVMSVTLTPSEHGMLIGWNRRVTNELESYTLIVEGLHKGGWMVLRIAGVPGVADWYATKGDSILSIPQDNLSRTIWMEVKRTAKTVRDWEEALSLSVDDVEWEPGQRAFHLQLKLARAHNTYYTGIIPPEGDKCFIIRGGLKEQRS